MIPLWKPPIKLPLWSYPCGATRGATSYPCGATLVELSVELPASSTSRHLDETRPSRRDSANGSHATPKSELRKKNINKKHPNFQWKYSEIRNIPMENHILKAF